MTDPLNPPHKITNPLFDDAVATDLGGLGPSSPSLPGADVDDRKQHRRVIRKYH